MTNHEIATKLFVSPATIRSHLENAFPTIGAHTRTGAIARLSDLSGPPRATRTQTSPAKHCRGFLTADRAAAA